MMNTKVLNWFQIDLIYSPCKKYFSCINHHHTIYHPWYHVTIHALWSVTTPSALNVFEFCTKKDTENKLQSNLVFNFRTLAIRGINKSNRVRVYPSLTKLV